MHNQFSSRICLSIIYSSSSYFYSIFSRADPPYRSAANFSNLSSCNCIDPASRLKSVQPSQQSHSISLPSKKRPCIKEMHSYASFSFLNFTSTMPSGCVSQNRMRWVYPILLSYYAMSFFTDSRYSSLSTDFGSNMCFIITIFSPSPWSSTVQSHENCFFYSIFAWIFFARFCFLVYLRLQSSSFWLNWARQILTVKPLLISLPLRFSIAIQTLSSLAQEAAASPFGKPFSSLYSFSFSLPELRSILRTPALLTKSFNSSSVISKGSPEMQIKVLIFALYHFSFFFSACLFAFFLFFSFLSNCSQVSGTSGWAFSSGTLWVSFFLRLSLSVSPKNSSALSLFNKSCFIFSIFSVGSSSCCTHSPFSSSQMFHFPSVV